MPIASTRIKPRLPARSTAERDSRGKYAKCGARPVKDTTGTRKLAKAGRRIYAEGLNSKKLRGAAGKRYERGLSGEGGHGIPGVLLPSQPQTEIQMTVYVGNGRKCGERINVEGQDFTSQGAWTVKDMRGQAN